MKMLSTAVALLFSVSLGSTACLPANAGTGNSASLIVKFVDLDVSRPEGAKQLYKRIRSAAVSVCGRLDSDAISRQADFFACVEDTVARTVAKIDSPALYVVHGAKTGSQIPQG
jgi:UrcA family protein